MGVLGTAELAIQTPGRPLKSLYFLMETTLGPNLVMHTLLPRESWNENFVKNILIA